MSRRCLPMQEVAIGPKRPCGRSLHVSRGQNLLDGQLQTEQFHEPRSRRYRYCLGPYRKHRGHNRRSSGFWADSWPRWFRYGAMKEAASIGTKLLCVLNPEWLDAGRVGREIRGQGGKPKTCGKLSSAAERYKGLTKKYRIGCWDVGAPRQLGSRSGKIATA